MEQVKAPNLYTLKEEICLQRAFQRDKINEKRKLEQQVEEIQKIAESPKTTKLDNVRVQGTPQRTDLSMIPIKKEPLEEKIKELDKEINDIEEWLHMKQPLLDEIRNILKEHKDKEQQMYFEYYFEEFNMCKIGVRHGCDISTVSRKIAKIEENLQNAIKCN